jgi:hypothetical protein
VIARSQAAVRSVLGQFGTGKAPFVAVLEALGGLYGDQEARLQLLADAHAAAIALREGDLGDTVGIAGATSMASAAMPASGMPGASMARTARNPSAAPATTPPQAGGTGMAGM